MSDAQEKATGSQEKTDREWLTDLGVQGTLTNAVKAILQEQDLIKWYCCENDMTGGGPGSPEDQKRQCRDFLASYFGSPDLICDLKALDENVPGLQAALRNKSMNLKKLARGGTYLEQVPIFSFKDRFEDKLDYPLLKPDQKTENGTIIGWEEFTKEFDTPYQVHWDPFSPLSQQARGQGTVQFLQYPAQTTDINGYQVPCSINSDTAAKILISLNEAYKKEPKFNPFKGETKITDENPYGRTFPYDYTYAFGQFDCDSYGGPRADPKAKTQQYAIFKHPKSSGGNRIARKTNPMVYGKVARSLFTLPLEREYYQYPWSYGGIENKEKVIDDTQLKAILCANNSPGARMGVKDNWGDFYEQHPALKHVFNVYKYAVEQALHKDQKALEEEGAMLSEHEMFTKYYELLEKGDEKETFDILAFKGESFETSYVLICSHCWEATVGKDDFRFTHSLLHDETGRQPEIYRIPFHWKANYMCDRWGDLLDPPVVHEHAQDVPAATEGSSPTAADSNFVVKYGGAPDTHPGYKQVYSLFVHYGEKEKRDDGNTILQKVEKVTEMCAECEGEEE